MSQAFSFAAIGGWVWLLGGVWYRFKHREFVARTRVAALERAFAVLVGVGAAFALVTACIAALVGARFSLALDDTKLLMAFCVGTLLAFGFVWDSLVLVGSRFVPRLRRFDWESHGFFSLGLWPIVLLALTSYFVIVTSNITLVSLALLHDAPAWRDPFFYAIEAPLLAWTTSLAFDVGFWDALYFSCWPVELAAVVALVLMTRRPALVLHYCISLIVLYYVGRYAGLANPVQGPVFFIPDRYDFLAGTMTEDAVAGIAEVMRAEPSSVRPSALLLGGVSAMPSLHVGMVSLTVYWLAVGRRATLFLGIPWLLGVWSSTVLLGWHYALDGAGGLALAAACALGTRYALARFVPELAITPRVAAVPSVPG